MDLLSNSSPYVMGGPGLSGMNIPQMKQLLRRIDRMYRSLRRGKRRHLCMAINDAYQDGLVSYVDGILKPINRGSPDTCLLRAIDNYDLEDIIDCLNQGADINMIASDGKTPLIKATEKRSMMMVRILLERGADPNVYRSYTALHHATQWDLEAVRLLIAYGAKIDVKSYLGVSPLSMARNDKIREFIQSLGDIPEIKEPDVQ